MKTAKILQIYLMTLFVFFLQIDTSFAQYSEQIKPLSDDEREQFYQANDQQGGKRDKTEVVPSPSAEYKPTVKETKKAINQKIEAQKNAQEQAKGANGVVTANFCSSDQGVFNSLIGTGARIFNGLRDIIYVVAGFGIIAVSVGGFFGNMNWKWLGAIVISLVIIASAGELIVMITGCNSFNSALITNTLNERYIENYNARYNERYIESDVKVQSDEYKHYENIRKDVSEKIKFKAPDFADANGLEETIGGKFNVGKDAFK